MPKDATKNVDRYKIRGGQLNEFDFHQNQEEFSEQQRTQAANLIPGTPPEAKKATTKSTKTEKSAKAIKTASTKATKKATKSTKATKARKGPVGASAKKLAARKAAKKK
jgi:hypothetical protein